MSRLDDIRAAVASTQSRTELLADRWFLLGEIERAGVQIADLGDAVGTWVGRFNASNGEVARLTAERDELRDSMHQGAIRYQAETIARLTAENERLRDALTALYEATDLDGDWCTPAEGDAIDAARESAAAVVASDVIGEPSLSVVAERSPWAIDDEHGLPAAGLPAAAVTESSET